MKVSVKDFAVAFEVDAIQKLFGDLKSSSKFKPGKDHYRFTGEHPDDIEAMMTCTRLAFDISTRQIEPKKRRMQRFFDKAFLFS